MSTCRNCGGQIRRVSVDAGAYYRHTLTGKTECDLPPRFPGDELTWLARPNRIQEWEVTS